MCETDPASYIKRTRSFHVLLLKKPGKNELWQNGCRKQCMQCIITNNNLLIFYFSKSIELDCKLTIAAQTLTIDVMYRT